jgi:hypothetical protein
MMVPYLAGKNENPKANCFHGVPITAEDYDGVDALNGCCVRAKGKYRKVEGLVYDVDFPNFDPSKWNYPITTDITDIDLELCAESFNGVDDLTSYRLHVHRNQDCDVDTSILLSTCEDIANNYSGVRGQGWGGVGGMFSAGYNVGYKGRISPVALSPRMKKKPSAAADSIKKRLSIAGEIFHEEFSGKNVGFEEMMQLQTDIWPKNRDRLKGPVCWIVSKDLGNPQHVDDDISRSYAGWFMSEKDDEDASAWFLFPDWSVAIELCNNTWISWDGVHCAHCSSVPHLGENNHIYSLFTAITRRVYANAGRVNMCEDILRECRVKFESLQVDDEVSLRWVPLLDCDNVHLSKRARRKYGNKYRRWLHCVVSEIDYSNGEVKLCERNKNSRKLPWLTKSEVHNRVVSGWV